MEFNQESASTLFHYCNELADALRGVLNTQRYNSIDQIFWEQKLNELKNIIDGILGNDNKIESALALLKTLKKTLEENFPDMEVIISSRDKIL